MNCLSCRIPYQRLHSLNAWTPFSEKALFFTDFCFVASPSQNSVPMNLVTFWKPPYQNPFREPFSEPFFIVKSAAGPLLRTLLRTLPQNLSQNLLRTLLRTLCCRLSDPHHRNHKSLAIANHNFEVASFSRRNRSEIAVLKVFSESQ